MRTISKLIGLLPLLILCLVLRTSDASLRAEEDRQLPLMVVEQYLERTDVEFDTPQQLTMDSEYSDTINYTFSDYARFTGRCAADSRITIVVYTVNEKHWPVTWFFEQVTTGASGMFEIKAALPTLGAQEVLILEELADPQEPVHASLLHFERKPETVVQELLDYQLNLYKEYGRP